jgi:hypothetical protein
VRALLFVGWIGLWFLLVWGLIALRKRTRDHDELPDDWFDDNLRRGGIKRV